MRKYKGLDVLLAAMPRVLLKVKCKLIIVGEFYDSVDKYQRLIRAHKIENHVNLENRYVSNEEVPAIFQQADVLVLPYLSATQSAVARIAISNGLPVIASKTGGLSETVIEGVNGLLVPPGDSDALADRLVMYFKDNLNTVLAKNNPASSAISSGCRIIEIIEQTAHSGISAEK